MRKYLLSIFLFAAAAIGCRAQGPAPADIFAPICKYLSRGDCDRLSEWFSDNLEIEILGKSSYCSRNQAGRILKKFFDEHTPRNFEILHRTTQATMRYAIGILTAGGETFRTVICVNSPGERNYIEYLTVERVL